MSDEPKIATVMVVYNERIIQTKSYQSLLKELSAKDVLIYDNSPTSQDPPEGFIYVHDPSNPGVSTAYNFAASWAEKQGYSHLLLLDSDSNFPKGAIDVYKKEAFLHLDQLILPEVIANGKTISPFWFKWGKSWHGSNISLGKLSFQKKAAINSGMLIPLSQFKNTDGYDEKIPLDWSDIAFCRQLYRLNIGGVKISMKLDHDLSESKIASIDSVKFRYKTYMLGLKRTPARHLFERFLMLTWAKLKAFKLSLRYMSPWFIFHYSRKLFNA